MPDSKKKIRITTYLKGHLKAKVLQAIWAKTPRDYKGSYADYCSICVNRGSLGTCSVPLRHLTPEEIERMTPQSFKDANHTSEWLATSQQIDDDKATASNVRYTSFYTIVPNKDTHK